MESGSLGRPAADSEGREGGQLKTQPPGLRTSVSDHLVTVEFLPKLSNSFRNGALVTAHGTTGVSTAPHEPPFTPRRLHGPGGPHFILLPNTG